MGAAAYMLRAPHGPHHSDPAWPAGVEKYLPGPQYHVVSASLTLDAGEEARRLVAFLLEARAVAAFVDAPVGADLAPLLALRSAGWTIRDAVIALAQIGAPQYATRRVLTLAKDPRGAFAWDVGGKDSISTSTAWISKAKNVPPGAWVQGGLELNTSRAPSRGRPRPSDQWGH